VLQVSFSQEDVTALFKARYSHPHPRVQQRMEALYLKSQRMPHGEIRKLVKISSRTLVQWIRTYQDGGIDALKKLGWKGAKGALTEHREVLEEYFKKHPPISLKDACAKIKEVTGIERKKVAVRDFLRSLGMSFRKTGNIPGKADPLKQDEFKKKHWSPSFKKQKKGSDKCSSLMQLTLCGRGLWVFCGA
jgi:transposase